ncbi:HAD-IA family hydrolase [Marinilactibacillus psychrotolerans]|uniref:HAD family hydrolase n=1 Tax=Marinilactibacillus psychrotolerans TaxID=191770 RepID=A0A5R9BXY9_9LACT|nr:HAD-IA family hydrolase [Marinilactibacillus psychrotolerans]TLQ05507.1 HAD family hydrolase [Marinilactibacillus psychrotolerans]
MKTFIWDLDGTLINSYPILLKSLEETFEHFEVPYEINEVRKVVLNQSVVNLLKQTSADYNVKYEEVKILFSDKLRSKNKEIKLMDGALEVLNWTMEKGIENYIYTHKSKNAIEILSRLRIEKYFSEVVTSSNGFQRKPHSEGVDYLMNKYQLEKDHTYYIGDRNLDVEVAINANIKSINLTQPSSEINVNISKLTDIYALI